MSTDNNAYGAFMHPDLPFIEWQAGLKTPAGVMLPPTGRVAAYVCSAGASDYDGQPLASRIVTTLDAGLKQCRSNKGDIVVVLPGHSESVTASTFLASLVAGTRIIGVGAGSFMPTLRITDTAGQLTLDDNNVNIRGMKLRLEGANGITKAILITGADVALLDCDIEVASGATAKSAIAIEIGSGANRCTIAGCRIRGTATHNATDGIKVVAAVDGLRICGNEMIFSATAGNGLIHFTAAATNCMVRDNLLYNTHTSSTATIAVDNVASDGVFARNMSATTVGTGTAPTSTGIVFAGASSLWRCFENYSTPTNNTSGVITPVVDS